MANTNEALVYAWTNQLLGNTAGESGYAQPGNAPAATTVSTDNQASSGYGYSPAGTGTYGTNESLINPGYAASPSLVSPGALTAPSLPTSSTGIAVNPSGLAASVMATCGGAATVTAVSIAPAGSSTFTSVGFTLANSTDGEFTVPAAGQVKITYTGTPTWVWTAVG